MTHQKPGDRPSAEDALQLFDEIVREQTPRSLRWALLHVDGTSFEKFVWTSESLIHEVSVFFKSVLGVCPLLSTTFLQFSNAAHQSL